jgi:hypothetical protein
MSGSAAVSQPAKTVDGVDHRNGMTLHTLTGMPQAAASPSHETRHVRLLRPDTDKASGDAPSSAMMARTGLQGQAVFIFSPAMPRLGTRPRWRESGRRRLPEPRQQPARTPDLRPREPTLLVEQLLACAAARGATGDAGRLVQDTPSVPARSGTDATSTASRCTTSPTSDVRKVAEFREHR